MRRESLLCPGLAFVLLGFWQTQAQSSTQTGSSAESVAVVPERKVEQQQKAIDPAVLVDFLPALLEKWLAVEAVKQINSLEYLKRVFRVWEEGGLVSPALLE